MTVGKCEKGNVVCVTSGLVRLLGGCLLLSLTACGAPDSEKAPGQGLSVNKVETVGGPAATGVLQRGADQQNRKTVSSVQSESDKDGLDNRSIHGVPDMVVRDLASVDPRDRYRALDHWNVKGGAAPLDAVFEAMEDEDEAVRAKATAIVEQRWAEEHEKKRG